MRNFGKLHEDKQVAKVRMELQANPFFADMIHHYEHLQRQGYKNGFFSLYADLRAKAEAALKGRKRKHGEVAAMGYLATYLSMGALGRLGMLRTQRLD